MSSSSPTRAWRACRMGSLAATLALAGLGAAAGALPPLVPKSGSKHFTIVQFADIHLGEGSSGVDERSLAALEAVLDAEKPDLVVFTGDQITGEDLKTTEERNKYLDKLFKPLEDRKIPWATTLGNHDACAQGGCHGGMHPVLDDGSSTWMAGLHAAGSVPLAGRVPFGSEATAMHTVRSTVVQQQEAPVNDKEKAVAGDIKTAMKDMFNGDTNIGSQAQGETPVVGTTPTVGDLGPNDGSPVQAATTTGTFVTAPNKKKPYPLPEHAKLRKEYLKKEFTHDLSRTGADGFFASSGGGLTNYRLLLFASAEDAAADKPSSVLWFVDTGGGSFPEVLHTDQIDWIRGEVKDLDQKYGPLPGILYAHVPLQAYAHVDPHGKSCYGSTDDSVTPLLEDRHLFSVLGVMHVHWVFSGHNHGNDWCCGVRVTPGAPMPGSVADDARDVKLCYGRHSGYGGYSTPQLHVAGARVVRFDPVMERSFLWGQASAPSLKTWVRLENGFQVSQSPEPHALQPWQLEAAKESLVSLRGHRGGP